MAAKISCFLLSSTEFLDPQLTLNFPHLNSLNVQRFKGKYFRTLVKLGNIKHAGWPKYKLSSLLRNFNVGTLLAQTIHKNSVL